MARDAYSYLHFPVIAGIVLIALGIKKTLGHLDDPLSTVPALALGGGVAALPARPRRLPLPNDADGAPVAGSPSRSCAWR